MWPFIVASRGFSPSGGGSQRVDPVQRRVGDAARRLRFQGLPPLGRVVGRERRLHRESGTRHWRFSTEDLAMATWRTARLTVNVLQTFALSLLSVRSSTGRL